MQLPLKPIAALELSLLLPLAQLDPLGAERVLTVLSPLALTALAIALLGVTVLLLAPATASYQLVPP